MKKYLLLFGVLLDGVIIGLAAGLFMSTAQRLRLTQQIAGAIGGIEEHMPDG